MLLLSWAKLQIGVSANESLVDTDDFPRSDVDVFAARQARSELSRKISFSLKRIVLLSKILYLSSRRSRYLRLEE